MKLFTKIFAVLAITFVTVGSSFAKEVNLYTSRHYDSDDALYQKFTDKTGIKVNVISGKGKALMERLASEVQVLQQMYLLQLMRVIYGKFKKMACSKV